MKFLRAIAHNIKVQAHAIWLYARDPRVTWPPRILALLIAGYALSPIDLIPDFIPVIGLLDDAILIPIGIWLFRKIVPDTIYAQNLAIAESARTRPLSWGGAVLIFTTWLIFTLTVAYLLGALSYF